MTKKIFRVRLQQLLRRLRLLPAAERMRYHLKVRLLKKKNKTFTEQYPAFSLPPQDLAFDAYSAPDWTFYKKSGEHTAAFLQAKAEQYLPGQSSLAIYEWGCGPARIIRHLPTVFGTESGIYGSDYNPRTIEWCEKNITTARFIRNDLVPPLAWENEKFDMIYCVSVFTHLSAATGLQWIGELHRILKPGGLLFITTLGDQSFEHELLPAERKQYLEQGIVTRANYEEGKKMFLAWHNPVYVKEKLLKQFTILEHLPGGFPTIAQDGWIVRK